MEMNCFYCDNNIEEAKQYLVTFIRRQEEKDELLCENCYVDWLEGIKE